jgi:hypothetical protein
MHCRLAAFSLAVALAACRPSAPAPEQVAVPAMAAEAAPLFTADQVRERSERCAKVTGDQFRRDWKESGAPTPAGTTTADFASHYNARLDTCFYLLTVRHFPDAGGQDGRPAETLSKFLVDIKYDEQYGVFMGPASVDSPRGRLPNQCRIDAMFCASEGEWNVLARAYMQD